MVTHWSVCFQWSLSGHWREVVGGRGGKAGLSTWKDNSKVVVVLILVVRVVVVVVVVAVVLIKVVVRVACHSATLHH